MKKTQKKPTVPKIWIRIGIASDLDYFVENLSMLVGSGMNIAEAILAIGKELRSSKMRRITSWVHEEIVSGHSLSSSLEQTKLFPNHVVSLIKVGEESGRLAENLALVSEQQKKDRMFQSKLKSALLYPLFVLALTLLVSIGIAWFILPKLALVFGQLRVELPALTQLLIATGEFLQLYGVIAVPAFLFSVILFLYLIFSFPKTKFIGQTILFYLPGTGTLIRQVELARFSYLLGTLLEAGLPVTRALESLQDATTSIRYKKLYAFLRTNISDGYSFQKSFAGYRNLKRMIPVPAQQLIVAGEKSGNLSVSLAKINETYDAKIDATTKNLTVILEPILLVIVWLGVVSVALAIILPIYSLVGGLNTAASIEQNSSVPAVSREEPVADISAVTFETEVPLTTESLPSLEVLTTNIGYLNVRNDSALSGQIVGRVLPGEVYEYVDESNGWYQIILAPEVSGWVFGEYVSITEI